MSAEQRRTDIFIPQEEAMPDSASPRYVTVVVIPDGHSEPEERRVCAETYEDLSHLIDRAVNEAWDADDEPIDVRNERGQRVWSNRRFGDLT